MIPYVGFLHCAQGHHNIPSHLHWSSLADTDSNGLTFRCFPTQSKVSMDSQMPITAPIPLASTMPISTMRMRLTLLSTISSIRGLVSSTESLPVLSISGYDMCTLYTPVQQHPRHRYGLLLKLSHLHLVEHKLGFVLSLSVVACTPFRVSCTLHCSCSHNSLKSTLKRTL